MAGSNLKHHRINYIEFTVSDLVKAKAFYSSAFGWEFNDYGPTYAGIKGESGEVGGLRADPTVTKGGPLVILYSEDLEKSLAKVKAAGGKISKPSFAFPGGWRFHFEDPSGNELAVWSDK